MTADTEAPPADEQTLAQAAAAEGDAKLPPEAVGERLASIAEREQAKAEAEPEPEADEPEPEPAQDPFTRACPTCAGFGKTLTGSLVDGYADRPCPSCNGIGYQERRDRAAVEPEPAEAPVVGGERIDGAWQWGAPSA